MAEENQIDDSQKSEVPKDIGAKKVAQAIGAIPVSPYSNIQREISEEDLKVPALQRIMLSEMDKLENRIYTLENSLTDNVQKYNELNEKYHAIDKEKAILAEKAKTNKAQEVLYSFCLTSGSIMIGLAKTVWEHGLGGIFLAIGFFLILGGLITKIIKWN